MSRFMRDCLRFEPSEFEQIAERLDVVAACEVRKRGGHFGDVGRCGGLVAGWRQASIQRLLGTATAIACGVEVSHRRIIEYDCNELVKPL
jgi:hypothetical protein